MVVLTIITGCALSPGPSQSDYPLPTTASVLPLQIGNLWTYRYTIYGDDGTVVPFPDRDLNLRISGAFYMVDSGPPVPVVPYDNAPQKYSRIVYKYEWESLDSGYLVYHQGTGNAAARGLYLAGTFVGADLEFFDTARLWYAFPADSSMMWHVDLPGGDTTSSVIECISTSYSGWFITPDAKVPFPVAMPGLCYCYRETIGDEVFYRVFHPDFGQISMRHYISGILRESFLLFAYTIHP
jgi:hypothetical protein